MISGTHADTVSPRGPRYFEAEAAVEELVAQGPRGVPVLLAALRAGHHTDLAVRGLWRSRDTRVLPHLQAALQAAGDSLDALWLRVALCRLGHRCDEQERVLAAALEREPRWWQEQAAVIAGHLGGRAVPLLERALTRAPTLLWPVVIGLQASADPAATPLLLRLLAQLTRPTPAEPLVLLEVVAALGVCGGPHAFPALRELAVHGGSPELRAAAFASLARLADDRVSSLLLSTRPGQDQTERRALCAAICARAPGDSRLAGRVLACARDQRERECSEPAARSAAELESRLAGPREQALPTALLLAARGHPAAAARLRALLPLRGDAERRQVLLHLDADPQLEHESSLALVEELLDPGAADRQEQAVDLLRGALEWSSERLAGRSSLREALLRLDRRTASSSAGLLFLALAPGSDPRRREVLQRLLMTRPLARSVMPELAFRLPPDEQRKLWIGLLESAEHRRGDAAAGLALLGRRELRGRLEDLYRTAGLEARAGMVWGLTRLGSDLPVTLDLTWAALEPLLQRQRDCLRTPEPNSPFIAEPPKEASRANCGGLIPERPEAARTRNCRVARYELYLRVHAMTTAHDRRLLPILERVLADQRLASADDRSSAIAARTALLRNRLLARADPVAALLGELGSTEPAHLSWVILELAWRGDGRGITPLRRLAAARPVDEIGELATLAVRALTQTEATRTRTWPACFHRIAFEAATRGANRIPPALILSCADSLETRAGHCPGTGAGDRRATAGPSPSAPGPSPTRP